jgi:PAS domain S-box-containing protein
MNEYLDPTPTICRLLLQSPASIHLVLDAEGRTVGNAAFNAISPSANQKAFIEACERVARSRQAENFEINVSLKQAPPAWYQCNVTPLSGPEGSLLGAAATAVDITVRKDQEERLQRLDKLMVEAQSIAHLGHWEWVLAQNEVTWSEELYRIYGVAPERFQPTFEGYLEKLHSDDRPHVRELLNRVVNERIPFSFDERIHRPDASVRHLHTWGHPVLDQSGNLVRLIGVCQDITEQKEAEEKTYEAIDLWKKMSSLQKATIESTADGILVVDINGKVVDFNERLLEIWGVPRTLVENKSYQESLAAVFHLLEDPEECQKRLAEIFTDPDRESYDTIRFKDGMILDRYSRPQRLEGKTIGRVFSYRNVTARMRAESLLKESEARKSAILNSAMDSIISMSHEGKVLEFNRAAEMTFGYAAKDAIGKEMADLIIPPRFRDQCRQGLLRRMTNDQSGLPGKRIEMPAMRANESEFPAEISITAVSPAGAPTYTGIIRDVSERKRYQEEIEKSISLLRATLESTTDGILVVDRTGRMTHHNQKLADLWGFAPEVLKSMEIRKALETVRRKLHHPKRFIRKAFALYQNPDIESHDTLELTDGRVFETFSIPQRINDQYAGRVWSFRDVSEKRRSEKKISLHTARLKFLADASHTFAEARLELQKILDLAAEMVAEFQGEGCLIRVPEKERTLSQVASFYHVQPEIMEIWKEIIPRGFGLINESTWETVARTEKGCAVSVDREELRRRMHPEFWSFLDQYPFHAWVTVPLRVGGKFIGTLTVARYKPGPAYSREDEEFLLSIADRIALAIENAELYGQAQEAIRLRNEFILTASHELRTPLTPLRLHLQMLLQGVQSGAIVAAKPGKAEDVLKMAGIADQSVSRLVRLVEEMLEVARMGAGEMRLAVIRVDLSEVVQDVIERFRRDLDASHCVVEVSLEPNAVGHWDRFRIQQLVTNVLANAIKFGAGHPIRISVTRAEKHAILEIQDQGIGIRKEDLRNIFEPFARAVSVTKYGGLGLGLFIARQIVEAHQGRIHVESMPEKGTTFTIELPFELSSPK